MSLRCKLLGHKLDEAGAVRIHDHEGGFSHLDLRCDRCGTKFERFDDAGRTITVEADANPLYVASLLKKG